MNSIEKNYKSENNLTKLSNKKIEEEKFNEIYVRYSK